MQGDLVVLEQVVDRLDRYASHRIAVGVFLGVGAVETVVELSTATLQ